MEYKFAFEGKDYTVDYKAYDLEGVWFTIAPDLVVYGRNYRIGGTVRFSYQDTVYKIIDVYKPKGTKYGTSYDKMFKPSDRIQSKATALCVPFFNYFDKSRIINRESMLGDTIAGRIERVEEQIQTLMNLRGLLLDMGENLDAIADKAKVDPTFNDDVQRQLGSVYFKNTFYPSYFKRILDSI